MNKHGRWVNDNNRFAELGITIIEAAARKNILLRLCGSAAVWIHCSKRRDVLIMQERRIADLDFVSTIAHKEKLQRMLVDEFGFKLDPQFAAIPELRRSIFYRIQAGRVEYRCDVHFDQMEYCHTIDLGGRLETDYPTIPLAELVLSKLQIRRLSARDTADIQTLFLEHDLGSGDRETINLPILTARCNRDWGLWRTVWENLDHVRKATTPHIWASEAPVPLLSKLDHFEERMRDAPKTWAWKTRCWVQRLAPWLKWYEDVEDVAPPSTLR